MKKRANPCSNRTEEASEKFWIKGTNPWLQIVDSILDGRIMFGIILIGIILIGDILGADCISMRYTYTNRVLFSMALVLSGMIMLVRCLPAETTPPELFVESEKEAVILFDEMLITRQVSLPPPPMKPRIPPFVPEDVIQEPDIEWIIDAELEILPLPEQSMATDLTGWEERLVMRPTVRPRVIKIVEPTKGIPALDRLGRDIRVTVEFIVSERGDVVQVSVIAIDKIREDEAVPLESLDRDALEAILDAAKQWKFRPASHEGEPVPAPSTQIFFL